MSAYNPRRAAFGDLATGLVLLAFLLIDALIVVALWHHGLAPALEHLAALWHQLATALST